MCAVVVNVRRMVTPVEHNPYNTQGTRYTIYVRAANVQHKNEQKCQVKRHEIFHTSGRQQRENISERKYVIMCVVFLGALQLLRPSSVLIAVKYGGR